MGIVKGYLRVEKSKYQAQIEVLKGLLVKLGKTYDDYRLKIQEMDSFISAEDDNYETIRENLWTNIMAVQKAREMTENSIQMLQGTLDEFEQLGDNARETLDSAKEAAKSTIVATLETIKTIY